MKTKLITLVLGLALAGSLYAKKDMQIFKPEIFGGDYQYQKIDSVKTAFLPTMLYSLQKDGKHIGFALYLIGYTDYSEYTDDAIYVDKRSGNGVVYFLGVTKRQAMKTLLTLQEIMDEKRSGNSLNGNTYKLISSKGKIFYEEHYSMLKGHIETCWRIRKTKLGFTKGLFISGINLEPAFLPQKNLEIFMKDIEKYPEPQAYASWADEEGNGEVCFAAPVYVVYIGSSAWKGFGGSEMYVFKREYIHDETDTEGVFPDKMELLHKDWKYTVEDPSTMQGALLPLGDNIEQALKTIDEVTAGMEKQKEFYKGHKIWLFKKDKMPEGYVYVYDIPRESALNDVITIQFESIWPELMWTYSPDADTKGLWTNTTVMKKVRKILEKEQKKK